MARSACFGDLCPKRVVLGKVILGAGHGTGRGVHWGEGAGMSPADCQGTMGFVGGRK